VAAGRFGQRPTSERQARSAAGAAHDGSVLAAHDGSAGAAHDGSDELAQVEQEPDSQLEQELELDSQLEQDDLQHMCLNKPPKWKQPRHNHRSKRSLATQDQPQPSRPRQQRSSKTRFMEASSKQC